MDTSGQQYTHPTTKAIKGEYIGTDDTHNVYAAELTAIQMAVTLFKETKDEYKNVYVFTDNQSAIQAIDTPKHQSGQYIIKEILDTIDKIHELAPTCNIHIEWVPGHKNIEGNEQADQAAKAAATPSTTSPNTIMRSAQNRSIQSMARIKWETEWKTGRRKCKTLAKYESISWHHHWTGAIWSTTAKKARSMHHHGYAQATAI